MKENKNKCQDCGAVTEFFLCDACEDAMSLPIGLAPEDDRVPMKINLGHGMYATWNGGHYWNLFSDGINYDCFSFLWEKDRVTQQEALQAFLNHPISRIVPS